MDVGYKRGLVDPDHGETVKIALLHFAFLEGDLAPQPPFSATRRSVPKGHGLGIAVHRSFVSYIATIVEVSVDDKGKLTVPRVDTAIDCGTYVNPERIQSQIEGAAIMGLSLAKLFLGSSGTGAPYELTPAAKTQ